MRLILVALVTLTLLFPACKPKQAEAKPAETAQARETVKPETPEKKETPSGLQNEDLGDFQVNTGVSSASSRK